MRRGGLILVVLLLAGCAGMGSGSDTAAVAELKNTSGQTVGTARFTQAGNVVRILVETSGLPPGPHAVHVHAVGKCDPPDFCTSIFAVGRVAGWCAHAMEQYADNRLIRPRADYIGVAPRRLAAVAAGQG